MKHRIGMDIKLFVTVAAVMLCLITDAHGTNVRRATTGDKALDAILSGQYRSHLRYGKRFDPSLIKNINGKPAHMDALSELWQQASPEFKQRISSYLQQMLQNPSRDSQ